MIKRGILQKDKRVLVINQIDAKNQGLPEYEVEIAFDGNFYLKGYAPYNDLKIKEVRAVRDGYLSAILPKIDRYRNQREGGFETTDKEEVFKKYLAYTEYLRNYPESSDTWFETNPLTFEEWEKRNV